jgi:signal transduction histidine kinase/AraC-like DNA-binding protein
MPDHFQRYRIGLTIGPDDPFWVEVRETILNEASRLPLDLIQLDIDPVSIDPRGDLRPIIDELAAEDIDVLIDYGIPQSVLSDFLEHGKKVVFLNEWDFRHPNLVTPHGLFQCGQIAAKFINEQVLIPGRILILHGPTSFESRLNGFLSQLHPRLLSRVELVATSWYQTEAYQQLIARASNEPVSVVFGLSDSLAMAGRSACREKGWLKLGSHIIGVNGDPLALREIANGTFTATVETPAGRFGSQAVQLAYNAARDEPLPEHFNYYPRLITNQNVAEVALEKLMVISELPSRLVGVNRQREQQRVAQLETSLRINQKVGMILNRDQLLSSIVEEFETGLGYQRVQIYRWDEQQGLLLSELPGAGIAEEDPSPTNPLGEALLNNQPVYLPDIYHSTRYSPHPGYPLTVTRVLIPIHTGQRISGLLDLHSHHYREHSRQELSGLQALADQLGITLQNADLYGHALDAQLRAEKADRLKTRLLANVSHELRIPLTLILGYSQAALNKPGPYTIVLPEDVRKDFERIFHSGEHLLHLINDLIDLALAEVDMLELHLETVSTQAFLADIFASIQTTIESNSAVEWRLQLPELLPVIQADPIRLRQILYNLLSNAAKFTASGSITLGAELQPPHLHLWVADTGQGVSAELQEKIFEPFVSMTQSYRQQGMGLGLSITRRLVSLHFGSITLDSSIDQGSTFHLYLPLPTLEGHPLMATPALAENAYVLLISTRASIPDGFWSAFASQHTRVVQAGSASEVQAALMGGLPAALAWDMSASDPGDWALIETIRAYPLLLQLPFLMFHSAPDQSAPGLAGSLTSVLLKPAATDTLLDMVRTLARQADGGMILIVDDDPQACSFYALTIERSTLNLKPKTARNGLEACQVMTQENPALVILDLLMPEMDGFDVLRWMRGRKETLNTPVLVLSGQVLSTQDIDRLDDSFVTFQNKGILSKTELVDRLEGELAPKGHLSQATSLLVKQAIAYIHASYRKPISRQEIALALGVHKDYLSRIFAQEMHISTWDYLIRYRILMAKEHLEASDDSIMTIAMDTGFNDSSYFSRVFQKETGLTPREYRQASRRPRMGTASE